MPTPSFTVISWALLQQSSYVRKLILKHGLDALVLCLNLAVNVETGPASGPEDWTPAETGDE